VSSHLYVACNELRFPGARPEFRFPNGLYLELMFTRQHVIGLRYKYQLHITTPNTYTNSNRIAPCSFYKCGPISIIFGKNYSKIIYKTTVIDFPISPEYCCYTTLGKYEPRSNIFDSKCYTLLLHRLKMSSFSTKSSSTKDYILQQAFTIASSFTHTGLKSLTPFSQWHC